MEHCVGIFPFLCNGIASYWSMESWINTFSKFYVGVSKRSKHIPALFLSTKVIIIQIANEKYIRSTY